MYLMNNVEDGNQTLQEEQFGSSIKVMFMLNSREHDMPTAHFNIYEKHKFQL